MNTKLLGIIALNAAILAGFAYLGLRPQGLWKKVLTPTGDISLKWLLVNLGILNVVVVFFVTTVALNLKSTESVSQPIQGPRGEILEKVTLKGFKKEVADAARELTEKAEAYFKAGERDLAAHNYRDASMNYRKSVDALPTMSGYGNLGLSLSFISDWRKAEEALFFGLKIARQKHNRRNEAAFLGNIGNVFSSQGKLDQALEYYRQLAEILKELDRQVGLANYHNNVGIIYKTRGKLKEALKNYERGIEIYKEVGNRLGQAMVLNNMGVIYRRWREYGEAWRRYEQALELLKALDDPLTKASTFINMGDVLQDRDKYDESLNYFKKALKIYNRIGNAVGKANALNRIGVVYKNQEKLDEALASYNVASEISNKIGDLGGLAQVLGNIGNVHERQGNHKQALKLYNESLEMYMRIGDVINESVTRANIGLTYWRQRKESQALRMFKEVKAIYDKTGFKPAIPKDLERTIRLLETKTTKQAN